MAKKSEAEKNRDALLKATKELLTARPAPTKHSTKQRLTTAGLWARPHHSDALGVNPDQIPEATKALRAQGIMADFDSEGRCIITSDKQFQQVAKACGLKTGRDGYDHVRSGRDNERGKEEFRRRVERGDFD
jgi:hypothetical protein